MTFTPEDYRREAAKWVVFPSDPHREDTERMRAMLDAAAEMAQEKTCATCQHDHPSDLCDAVIDRPFCYSRVSRLDFGCTLWTPREP